MDAEFAAIHAELDRICVKLDRMIVGVWAFGPWYVAWAIATIVLIVLRT